MRFCIALPLLILVCFSHSFSLPTRGDLSKPFTNQVQDIGSYYYVSASSGLNYRDAPNGHRLSMLPLNTRVKLVEIASDNFNIRDDGKTLSGKWVGIEWEKDTVYVYSAYLSETYTPRDMNLLYAIPFLGTERDRQPGFVNLSELYPFSYEGNTIYLDYNTDEGPTRFGKKNTDLVLSRMKLARTDTLYIFSFSQDSVYRFTLQELEMVAYANIYGASLTGSDESTSEFGLDLGKQYTSKGENFVYIGRENPFQTGQLMPLIWEKVDNGQFPLEHYEIKESTLETHKLTYAHYEYFIQSHKSTRIKNRINDHRLVVKNTHTGELLPELYYRSGESTHLLSVSTMKDEGGNYYSYAWTGTLFKGKPPIIYGLYSSSFGCPAVDFIDQEEKSLYILCDNRH